MKIKLLIFLVGILVGMEVHGQCSAYFTDSLWNNPILVLKAPMVPGRTYNWSLWNGGGQLSANQNVAWLSISSGASPTVVLTVTEPGCSSTFAKTCCQGLPPMTLPSIPAMGENGVCGSGIYAYNVFYYQGVGTGSCYMCGAAVQGGVVVGQTLRYWPDNYVQNTYLVDWDSVGLGRIVTAHGLCNLPATIEHCTTNVAINCRVNGPQTVCVGDTGSYRQYCQPGSTYAWSTTNGTILSGQSTDQIQVHWTVPGLDTVVTIYNSLACGLDTNYYPVLVSAFPSSQIHGDTTACALAVDTLTASPLPQLSPPAVYNLWEATGGGLNLTASNQSSFQYVHGNGPVETVVLTTGDHGCVTRDTFQLTIHPSPVPPIPSQPVICTGDSVLLDAGPGYATYAWSTGSSLSSIFASTATPYTVSVTDLVHHCLGTATSIPVLDPDCVWPGDADHDYIVDLNDFLAIGVAFGDTGPARSNAVNSWLGQPATNWANSFLSGQNHKHADSDGNGLVDYPDTVCVSLHQGFAHLKTESLASGVPLRITPSLSPFAGQDSIELIVSLGDAMLPADSAYGLTFQIDYAASDVYAGVDGSTSNSFMGNPGGSLIDISDEDANAGRFGWAMVRTDHQPTFGNGEVCRIKLKARPSVWAGHGLVQLPLHLSHYRLIDPVGRDIPITALMDTVWLYDLGYVHASEAVSSHVIHFSPNPAKDVVHLRLPGRFTGPCLIQMFDTEGKEVLRESYHLLGGGEFQDFNVDVSHFPAGMYALRFRTIKEMESIRVAVVR